ncbi:hypothetical protein [Streptomyces shenzhenensis]|uniref:hypothetical protein n=1 Tax=Streptomyces shenzhenensis TaxID=943815 RepID=UPI0033E2DC49
MDFPESEPARPTADDTALLAEDSLLAERLRALGSEGEGNLALGLLRDAHDMLIRPDRYHQPYVIAQATCRTAIDCLMNLGGNDHKALLAARNDLKKALRQVFQPDGACKVTKPLDRLLAALDSLAVLPVELLADSDLNTALVSLHRSRTRYKAALPDPVPQAEALRRVVDALDELDQVPAHLSEQLPITAALKELHTARVAPGFRQKAVLDGQLAAAGAAYARLLTMENDQGSQRIQQVTALVRELTGREPGAGELKAWSDYYQSGSKIIHAATRTNATDAVKLLHNVLLVIRELVFTLPDQATQWVALGAVISPTEEQVQEVNQLHHPSATPYLFSRFTGWNWLELLSPARLLPEADRWPAAPYFQRLATEDPVRLTQWLQQHLNEISANGPRAADRLMWLCQHLTWTATPLVAGIIKLQGVHSLRIRVLFWALDVDPQQRDAQWVDLVRQALVAGAGASPIDSWDIGSGLEQLQETARAKAPLAAVVGNALIDVLSAYLTVDGVRSDLQIREDLRSPSLSGSPALTGAWLAAAACLKVARAQHDQGIDLAARTNAWTSDALGGWERDRLLATHLLDVADDERDETQWRATAFTVLGRLDAMPVPTADVATFVRTVVEKCGPEHQNDLAAALRDSFGPVPDAATLQTARTEYDERDTRLARVLDALESGDDFPEWTSQVPSVWRTIWALSGGLPADVLMPWQPVVDLLTEYFGPPHTVSEPTISFLALPDDDAEAVAEFRSLCEQHGPVHGAAVLAACPPTPGNYFERTEFRLLEEAVYADADVWAANISSIADALGTFDLRAVYLGALHTARQAAGLTDPQNSRATAAIAAAWQLITQLHGGVGSADPDLDERARRTTCHLLKDAWSLGINPGLDETEIITWLMASARDWSEPTQKLQDAYATATATSGGLALVALVQWAVHRASLDGELPALSAELMTNILMEHTDDRALAVMGAALTPLRLYAEAWYSAHQDTLLDLASDNAPVRSWLLHLQRLSAYDCDVIGDIASAKIICYLRADAPRPIFNRFAMTLVHSPETLDPSFLVDLSNGEGGPEAVSKLLGDIARALPADPNERSLHTRGLALWEQVLELAAGTPGGHLRGAGHFAFAEGLDHDHWLHYTLRTVTINPDVSFPDRVAERAARTPHSPDTRAILTKLLPLVSRPESRDNYRMPVIIQHAQAVLHASEPGSPGRSALGQSLALHADDVEAAAAD